MFSHAAHFSDTTSGAGKRPRLVVLGGGLAGLAAAREALLKHPGCDVLVLEREAQVGGMAVSVRFGDCVSDLGPHRIYSAIPEMRQWFQDTVGDGLYTVRRQSRMYVRGRYLQYPPSVGQMVSAFGVPNMAKFGTGYAWAKARSLAGMIDTSSFGGVMERSFGRPLCEAMVFPYMRKTWKIEPDKISAEAARIRATMGGVGKMLWRMVHPQQRAGEESTLKSFHYVRGGIGNLAIKLREDVERLGGRVICRADVRRVTLENGRAVRVEYRNAESEICFEQTDFIISTIPITNLVRFLALEEGGPGVSGDVLNAVKGLRWLRGMLVFLLLKRPAVGSDHWLYFPEAIPNVNRAYEPKNFDETLAPRDRTLLCIEGTALSSDDEDWNCSADGLAAAYASRVAATGALNESEITDAHVKKIDYAYPLYDMGFLDRLERIWTGMSGIRNLVCAGRQGLFQHNNMDHTIFTGLHAARFWNGGLNDPDAAKWYSDVMRQFQDFRIVD